MAQKPLNLAEYKAAFSRFLMFFLFTLVVCAFATYFNFIVPRNEVKILREHANTLRNQNITQEAVKQNIIEIISVLEKADSSMSGAILDVELKPRFEQLKASINLGGDSTAQKNMNFVLYDLLNKYKDNRFQLAQCKNFPAELAKRDKELAELRDRIKTLNSAPAYNPQYNSPPPVSYNAPR